MHRHVQFANDGVTIEGISFLSAIEVGRRNLLYFPETDENGHITFGWRFINGEWLEPLPPAEEDTLKNELCEIDCKLRQIYDEEQFSAWKGEAPKKGNGSRINEKKALLARYNKVKAQLAELCGEN